MLGAVKIVNTPDDLSVSQMTREQIIEMATITVRYDDAVYPPDYDASLKEGDDGYIEPEWRYEEEIDQSALLRFGVSE